MERDFRYLRDQHGDAGAREVFEKICSVLLAAIYPNESHSIRSSQGDGGIDIFVGDFSAPGENFQCKYFIDGINKSQRGQIQNSFNTAIESKDYTMKRWVLCVPCNLSIAEMTWWSSWRLENQNRHKIKIDLWDGTRLITEMKKQSIYDTAFDDDIRKLLDEIHVGLLAQQTRLREERIAFIRDTEDEYQDAIFVKKLENAAIKNIEGCKRDFFNAELSEHALQSRGNTVDLQMFDRLKYKVFGIWETQYRQHQSEDDGNELLTKTYERIEELDTTTLQCLLAESNLFAKKGIVHQYAEDCSVGWLADYKAKLDEYLKKGAEDNA